MKARRVPVLVAIAFAAGMAAAQLPEPLFPLLREAASGNPLTPIAQQSWGAEAEEPKEGPRNVASGKDPERPFADRTLPIGEFRARKGQGTVKLLIDYAGFETAPIQRGDRDNWVVVNVALRCPYVEGGRCLGEQLPRTGFQSLFETRPDYANSLKRTPVKVGGRERVLLTGTQVLEYDIVPDELMKLYFSFNAPANVETHQVRATILQGEYTTAVPVAPPREAKPWGLLPKAALLLAFALAAFFGLRALARRMNE